MPNEFDMELLLREFWPSNWYEKEEEEKIGLCQELENHLASQSGREPYAVKSFGGIQNYGEIVQPYHVGRTDPQEKTIEVKIWGDRSSFDVLQTVVKESSHADQYELFKKQEMAKNDKDMEGEYKQYLERKGLSDFEVTVMKWESNNYLTPPHAFYQTQFMEIDAVYNSAKFLKYHNNLMGDQMDTFERRTDSERTYGNFYYYTKVIDELIRPGEELQERVIVEPLRSGLVPANDVRSRRIIPKTPLDFWVDDRKDRNMFSPDNDLELLDGRKLSDIILMGRVGNKDLTLLTRVKKWQDEKLEAAVNGPKIKRVTLDELEVKESETRVQTREHSDEIKPSTPKSGMRF